MTNKKIDYLLKKEEGYEIKIEDMTIEMKYSDNNKKFEDSILNILKMKLKN